MDGAISAMQVSTMIASPSIRYRVVSVLDRV